MHSFFNFKKKFHHGHDWNHKNGVRIFIRKAGLKILKPKGNTLRELCHHFSIVEMWLENKSLRVHILGQLVVVSENKLANRGCCITRAVSNNSQNDRWFPSQKHFIFNFNINF